MPTLFPPSVPASQLGRAASEIGMAGLLGGALFGRLALHPALVGISDPAERGKVLNASWRRYGMVNSLSLAAVVAGWVGARAAEARDENLSAREQRLARVKDGFVAASALTGVATAVQGNRFAHSAPAGAVPLRDGDHTTAGATDEQARRKRVVSLLGLASIGANVGLVAANAALAQENFRRPPARRLGGRLRR